MPSPKLADPPEVAAPPEQPGADVTTDTGPRLPQDRLTRRLLWAVLVSVLVNALLWHAASQVVRNHILAPPVPITFKRIFLLPRPKPPKRKPHKKIVHKIVRPKPKPKPKPSSSPSPWLITRSSDRSRSFISARWCITLRRRRRTTAS